VGVAVLWLRPGALPAFERDPGVLDDERGGVAWECDELEWDVAGVVEAVGVTADDGAAPAGAWPELLPRVPVPLAPLPAPPPLLPVPRLLPPLLEPWPRRMPEPPLRPPGPRLSARVALFACLVVRRTPLGDVRSAGAVTGA
jgi:hypothetical protein